MPSLSQVTLVDSTISDEPSMTLFNVSVNSSLGNDVVNGMMEAIKTANMPKCNELREEITIVGNTMHASMALIQSFSDLVAGYIEEEEFYKETLLELQKDNGSPDDIAKYTADLERCQKEINYNQEFITKETAEIAPHAAKVAGLKAQLEELENRTSAAYKFIICDEEMHAIYSNSNNFGHYSGRLVKDVGTEDVAMTEDLSSYIVRTAVDCLPYASPAA
ncbi:hypothetical protein IW136_000246 [Coemansia sp. RSA 678]|nr:hypothetical protein IW136_000246 [Coemansia sp. RSA 678]